MDVNNKYKKWGWGAVIGLVGVILVSGIVVAATMSSPKKATTASTDGENEPVVVADESDETGDDEETGRDNDKEQSGSDSNTSDSSDSEQSGSGASANDSSDKKNGASTTDDGAGNSDSKKNNAANDSKTNAIGSNAMPKTGPEDDLVAIIGWAIAAGLATHLILAKNRA